MLLKKLNKNRITIETLILISLSIIATNMHSDKIKPTINNLKQLLNPNPQIITIDNRNYFKQISFQNSEFGYLSEIISQSKHNKSSIQITAFLSNNTPKIPQFKKICFQTKPQSISDCYTIWPKNITSLFPQGRFNAYTRDNIDPKKNKKPITVEEINKIESELFLTYLNFQEL
ncbi:MAG: hypothetical protein KC550_01580 [Nanoarchaeota archaeon]|nr:hypothetical protein [Nanoarchaeota archaeon]